ncbi:MAG TPA: SDR family oxidoreductase [Sporichthyaceae bacterium]|jgi:3-oxoacyl-[acyl-carrier protein] reductase
MLAGLAGSTAVVTGAAGGIGRAICARLSAEGVRVVAADLDVAAVEKVVAELPTEALPLHADVTDEDSVRWIVECAVSAFGRVDMMQINAGIESAALPVAEFDIVDYRQVFDVNVLGAFLCARAAVRQMSSQATGGRILFTASVSALKGDPGVSVYVASKHAVLGLARCLAKETATAPIRVNTLCPGLVDTRMMRSLEERMGAMTQLNPQQMKSALEGIVPKGRYACPEEVAAISAWILSDEASYCHGEVFTVSGGLAP